MRLYYGWWIVGAGMVALMVTFGVTILAFGIYVLPVSQDFGLSRADTNTGIILVSFGLAIWSVFVGRMLDRHSARRIMAFSAGLFAGSLVTLGLSHNVWLSAVVLAVPLPVSLAGAGNLAWSTLVARWFTVHRGRAMAITMIGLSLGTLIVAPVMGLSVAAIGWRKAMIIVGLAIGAAILLLSFFVRERPGPNDVEVKDPDRAAAATRAAPGGAAGSLSVARLLRSPLFWMLSLGASLSLGTLQATTISLVPLARGTGLNMTEAASLLSIVGGMNIVGKLVLAAAADRLDRVKLLAIVFALVALANAALLIGDSFAWLAVCSAGIGLGAGAITPGFLALLADRFGQQSFGTANGLANFIMSLTGASLVRYSGEVFDRTGSYHLMFMTFVALGVVAVLLTLATRLVPARIAGEDRVGLAGNRRSSAAER